MGPDCQLMRRGLIAGSGGGFTPPTFSWVIPGASTIQSNLASMLAGNFFQVIVGGITKAEGYRPATVYNALWTRDNAYVIWHQPTLLTATQRRTFASYYIAQRSVSPADFIADRIDADGTVHYLNPGASFYPFMDGIAMTVLALWSDWNLTGSNATFLSNQTAINACLAALPRSASHCVYSDPANPSVDYGFTDTVLKTGDVAYGTALLAWAYRMCGEMAGDTSYDTDYANAKAGLATLRDASGWYVGSSGNNSGVYDVWATALAVAENLVTGSDRTASANKIASTYLSGSSGPLGYTSPITQFGLVRHLPVGQYWSGTSTTPGTYQNGGYWLTPLWDCVRAVQLVDPATAITWATEAMQQLTDEHTAEGTWANVPYEWHNYGVGVGAKGYSASAAIVNRFV